MHIMNINVAVDDGNLIVQGEVYKVEPMTNREVDVADKFYAGLLELAQKFKENDGSATLLERSFPNKRS